MYKRVLLKLSGEQLAGKSEGGIDTATCKWLADEVKKVVNNGTQVVIMVGGGNFARGRQLAGGGISKTTAHKMGIIAMVMNAMALKDIFESNGIATKAMSAILGEPFTETFSHHLAENHLKQGQVVIALGGARPYLTSDTGAVLLALELNCNVVLKATKVDGVYDNDPVEHLQAKKLEALTFREALTDEAIRVMDKSALGAAMEHNMPVVVFDAMKPGNIAKAARGETVGTKIS